MRRYPEVVRNFIAENVQGITTKDLAILVNAKFGTNFTEAKMKCYKSNHKLKSGRRGVPFGRASKKYPQEVKDFIADNYKGTGHRAMAEILNRVFGTNYTADQIKGYYANHKFDSGITGFFPKGHVPFNKGKKGVSYEGMKATQFPKGNKPANWRPLGSERISKDGYIEVKVADGKLNKNWKAKHIMIWEAVNGPIPKGYVVIFGDRNPHNFELDNLILVSRAQLVRLNQNHMIQNDAELTRTAVIIADIQAKISQRKRGQKHSCRKRRGDIGTL